MAGMEVFTEEPIAEVRRTSERTRGKKVTYNEKELSKSTVNRPEKRVKCQRSNGAGRKPKVREITKPEQSNVNDIEVARGLMECPNERDGLMALGLKLEAVQDDASAHGVEKSDHLKVKETLRIFNNYYLHLIQVCNFLHLI